MNGETHRVREEKKKTKLIGRRQAYNKNASV